MTNEQESNLDKARQNLKFALRLIEALFDDKSVTEQDVDDDTSEAIDRCNAAVDCLYEAKKTEKL